MIFGKTEKELYHSQDVCYICKGSEGEFNFDDVELRKARDHCHLTGKFRGAAHF